MNNQLQLGAHMSIAGGPQNAFGRSADVAGTSMQVFAKSPRGWKIPEYTDEQFDEGVAMRKKYNQIGGMVHSNYLANLAKFVDECETERASILHDFEFAYRLGYDSVNVHIGKLKGRTDRDEAMRNMVENVEVILKEVANAGRDSVQYVFENTAGQGSEIGSTLEEMSYFYKNYLHDLPVKFTIDTAHCQGGGIDFTQRDEFLEQFDSAIGVENIHAIHLNDSKAILGSNLDRHASLGRGFIGFPRLVPLIQWSASAKKGIYIETPEPTLWPEEIALVKKIIAGEVDRIDQFHKEHYKTQFLKKFASQAEETQQDSLFG